MSLQQKEFVKEALKEELETGTNCSVAFSINKGLI